MNVIHRTALIAILQATAPVVAGTDPSQLCMDAAARAAAATGVPLDVLTAISLVETGRGHRPWPWAVNLGGDGHWPDSRRDAVELAESALAQGRTNIDLGCFQLNYHWHGAGFASLFDMLDPTANALYAADYLAGKYAATGDWALAAAAYHSTTPEHAQRYRTRFEARRAELGDMPTVVPQAERLNGFPLLLAGRIGTHGSLVPDRAGGHPLIEAP